MARPRLDATAVAWIRGSAVARGAAIDEAARILSASRMPVIAGMATDADGAAAAVELARRVGAAVNHAAGAALIGLRDAMIGVTTMLTTPPEARARADFFLAVGSGLTDAWPDVWQFLRPDRAPTLSPDAARRVIRLCPGDDPWPLGPAQTIGGDLAPRLAVLRALVNGHRLARTADRRNSTLAPRRCGRRVTAW